MPHDAFETVQQNSTAPVPYGWKLSNDAMSSSVMIDGVETALNLSDFFECGIALGKTAAAHPYLRNCDPDGIDGPLLSIHSAGAVAVLPKGVEFEPVNIAALLETEIEALDAVPDLFMPRLGNAALLAGANACPDPNGTRGVYFYASRLDPAALAEGEPDVMIITWNDILPAGDCDAAPNSFQMVVTAQPRPDGENVRAPARVEYRYGDCGWAVPDQANLQPVDPDLADPRDDLPEVHGARSGMLFDSASPAGGQARRGIEVLGAREQAFDVLVERDQDGEPVLDADGNAIEIGTLAHGRHNGASGNPRRFEDYCNFSNVNAPPDQRPKGHFVFDLTSDGIPLKDDDGDGVPDGDDGYDNCEGVANPYQGNSDGDVFGDACDRDADNDNLFNIDENCDLTASSFRNPWTLEPYSQVSDSDEDGLGDACDLDIDNDGISNGGDNCPELPNPLQTNWDADNDGMRCDADDEAIYERILALIARVDQAGWSPAGPMIEIVNFTEADSMPDSTKYSFAERWSAQTGKSLDEIWTFVDASLSWPLPDSQRASLQMAVSNAYDETGDDDLWLLYDWSKTDLALGEFVSKHGAWFVQGTD